MKDAQDTLKRAKSAPPAARARRARRKEPAQPRHWRDALLRRMLGAADVAAVAVASLSFVWPTRDYQLALWLIAMLPLWILLAKLLGLYDNDHRALRHLTVDEFPLLFTWAVTATVGTCWLFWVLPFGPVSLRAVGQMLLVVLVAAFTFRALARVVWPRMVPRERTIIVGEGPLADATRRKLELFGDIHVELVDKQAHLSVTDLRDSAAGLDRIILASQHIDEEQIAELVALCRQQQIKLSLIPPARGVFGTAVRLKHIADLPVVEYNTWDVSRSTLALKRAFDLVVSSLALVLLSPLYALISLAILIDSGRPALLGQWRAGLHARPFRMYKFRTMVVNAEELLPELVSVGDLEQPAFKLRDDPRVTRIGRILRRTSLDELPQFFNVLRGDMSLVGPRPEELSVVEHYRPEHRFRLELKPGITGPMQVYGRGELEFDERLAVEREYIENLSLSRDLRILALTAAALVNARGAF